MKRALTLLAVAAALFAGCATPPPQPEPAQPEAPPPAEPQAAPVPVVVTPAAKAEAQKLALRAAEMLEEGKLAEAGAQLEQALATDPGNRVAVSLSKQMTADPVATLGSESFDYTIRAGDTLSRIAGRFLGDVYRFHILARYNDIAVPKQVHVGQVIKVPGKAPPPSAAPEPAAKPAPVQKRAAEHKATADGRKPAAEPAAPEPTAAPPAEAAPVPVSPGERAYQSGLQAMKAGNKEGAYAAFVQATRLDPNHGEAKAKAAQLRQELIQTHHRNATAAFHRQDMEGAIRNWDKVLELDPGNESAKLNRQRALDLSERIRQMR